MQIRFLFGGGSWSTETAPVGADYRDRIARTDDVAERCIGSKETDPARRSLDESATILDTLTPRDFVIMFDERGKSLSSEQFAQLLERVEQDGKTATIVVGGAYGVSDDVRARADATIAISSMIFPHELARIIALEQVYRARSITRGSKYHHAG